jgi:uncharacterized sporulation protein YeaH/YhbH (DUF444 family)
MTSHVLIDRRQNDSKKSLPNRNRYLKKVRDQIRESVKKTITDGSIKDTMSDGVKKVKIKNGGLNQPEFRYATGSGVVDHVASHNDQYRVGDRIRKPPASKKKGDGGGAGKGSGNSQDEFEFTITKEEFLDIFFEDLELPNLSKKQIVDVPTYTMSRAGFTVDGSPSRLNILRSMKTAKARRMALRTPKKRKIKELEQELKELTEYLATNKCDAYEVAVMMVKQENIEKEIVRLKKRLRAVPYLDDIDLRYNFWERKPQPSTKAVVFGILDVSGSMTQFHKEMAKRFFILALLFLQRKYERVDIVWVRHTDTAQEVTEEDFFHSRETGGTIVSSALNLMHKIQQERYPSGEWNIYGVQMSDGDNLHLDNEYTHAIMKEKILPACQYFAYVEVNDMTINSSTLAGIMQTYQKSIGSDLYTIYKALSDEFPNFAVAHVNSPEHIYPVFRKLFRKKNGK